MVRLTPNHHDPIHGVNGGLVLHSADRFDKPYVGLYLHPAQDGTPCWHVRLHVIAPALRLFSCASFFFRRRFEHHPHAVTMFEFVRFTVETLPSRRWRQIIENYERSHNPDRIRREQETRNRSNGRAATQEEAPA